MNMERFPVGSGAGRAEDADVEENNPEAPKNVMFRKELLAFSGVNSLEDARSEALELEDVFLPDAEGDEKAGEFAEKRCKFCHQPIRRVVRVRSGENIALIGNDCARKLIQFQDTGKIESVTKTMRDARRRFKETFEDLTTDEEKNVLRQEGRGGGMTPFASMLVWSARRIKERPDDVPDRIRQVMRQIEMFDAPLAVDDATEFLAWYVETRTLIPEEIFTPEEERLFERHPHRQMIRAILEKRPDRNIADTQRIVKIVRHYKESVDEAWKTIDTLVQEGIVFQMKNPLRRIYRKDGRYTTKDRGKSLMLSAFAEYFPKEYLPDNPEIALSRDNAMRQVDVYAYEATPMDQFMIESHHPTRRLRYTNIPQDAYATFHDFVLHVCYTVAVDNYGKIQVMKGDEVVS